MRKRPTVTQIIAKQKLPRFLKVRQKFPENGLSLDEIKNKIYNSLSEERFSSQIKPGMRIAITAGSRGIANVAFITKTIADFVAEKGAEPFVVPAMGSHGGATDEGQKNMLETLGISEDYLGYPILSSMEVVNIGKNDEGSDVFIDKNAYEADGIIISCRVKPHTAFRGKYESGMMKMMAIGLGKQHGAEACHVEGFQNMGKNVELFGKTILKNCNILFGVGAIENAYDETCKIAVLNHDEIMDKEPDLLKESYKQMASILVDSCDVLIVDQIGKNYSGDGMDPNITGTFSTPHATGGIKSQRVAVLNLSPETHGNALGVGMADATTERVYQQLDLASMYINAITCTVLDGVNIPLIMESDKECIQVCLQTCTEIDKSKARIVRIKNSMDIKEILLSEAYLDEIRNNPKLEIVSEPFDLPFDDDGNLF